MELDSEKADSFSQLESMTKKEPVVKENLDSKVEETLNPLAIEDPFAYLDRSDFTSEKFKVEVRNLPKYYGIAVST